jgi:cytochrome bd-type quinol oxidase subunit 2
MGGWFRYLALNAQSRAGLSANAVIWGAVAALAAGLAFILFTVAAFLWLADRYHPVVAGLVLGGIFFLVALIAAALCFATRARNITRARTELAEQKAANAAWLDPKLVAAGLQMADGIGWRRLGSLAVVALIAAGLAYEWRGQKSPPDDKTEPEK